MLMSQDGSPAGFVLTAMDGAHVPRPEQSWGQVVYEQEAASVLKRYDEVSCVYSDGYDGRKLIGCLSHAREILQRFMTPNLKVKKGCQAIINMSDLWKNPSWVSSWNLIRRINIR